MYTNFRFRIMTQNERKMTDPEAFYPINRTKYQLLLHIFYLIILQSFFIRNIFESPISKPELKLNPQRHRK